jgi:hypothetical protein
MRQAFFVREVFSKIELSYGTQDCIRYYLYTICLYMNRLRFLQQQRVSSHGLNRQSVSSFIHERWSTSGRALSASRYCRPPYLPSGTASGPAKGPSFGRRGSYLYPPPQPLAYFTYVRGSFSSPAGLPAPFWERASNRYAHVSSSTSMVFPLRVGILCCLD